MQTGAAPSRIIVGPDGFLWFTEIGKNTIGRISTGGVLQEFTAVNGISGSSIKDITMGTDGNIWYTEYGSNKIAKLVW